jgi:hypothetical protein
VVEIENVLNETCFIGLSYINTNGLLLKQAQYAGFVITVDKEEGITVKLDAIDGAEKGKKSETPNFHNPASLDAWFIAPKSHYKNSEYHIDIVDHRLLCDLGCCEEEGRYRRRPVRMVGMAPAESGA